MAVSLVAPRLFDCSLSLENSVVEISSTNPALGRFTLFKADLDSPAREFMGVVA